MAVPSPILPLHRKAQAVMMAYGEGEGAAEVVAGYEDPELEYAALRKSCVLLDLPQRAVIEVAGADRVEFLNRMVTQELKGMPLGSVRRSFWLNRKGRIDADLRVICLEGRVLLETDIHAAARTVAGLSAFVITEDVTIRDLTQGTHRLAVHGPTGEGLVGLALGISGLEVGQAAVALFEGAHVVVFREDTAGERGYEIVVPVGAAMALYQKLIEVGHDASHGAAALREKQGASGETIRLRPAGWHAYNIARIEAGTPLYNIDFGPNSLPAETGVLEDRVSFKKGCYLGQEVVARMHSRGHSKQVLVGIKFDVVKSPDDFVLQPVGGAGLFPVTGAGLGMEPVGGVTSSTISPMLGSAAIGLAQVKQSHKEPGMVLGTVVDGVTLRGIVQPSLAFWER